MRRPSKHCAFTAAACADTVACHASILQVNEKSLRMRARSAAAYADTTVGQTSFLQADKTFSQLLRMFCCCLPCS
jgi:hypothetical protein